MGGIERFESDSQASPSNQHPSMLLLTGPNYSGKSVYMKQVGTCPTLSLARFLKALGCSHCLPCANWKVWFFNLGGIHETNLSSFVPAESAELGITDKILTKINTQETVSKVCRVS